MTYLVTLIVGITLGALLQDGYDLMASVDALWARIKARRRG
jgi:hypothetical protein